MARRSTNIDYQMIPGFFARPGRYQQGGVSAEDSDSDFFNALADRALNNEQQRYQQSDEEQDAPPQEEQDDIEQEHSDQDYDTLQSQYEELSGKYDALQGQQSEGTEGLEATGDGFMDFLFEKDNSNLPMTFDNDNDTPNPPAKDDNPGTGFDAPYIAPNSYISAPDFHMRTPSKGDLEDDLRKGIANRETPGAKNPYNSVPRKADGSLASSAAGKYQFMWSAWGDSIKKVTGVKDKESFLKSPTAQEKFFNFYNKTVLDPESQKDLPALRKYYPNITENQVKMMIHFGGIGNVRKAIRTGNFNKKLDAFGQSIGNYAMQNGGEVRVTSPNDPRLQMYNDSLEVREHALKSKSTLQNPNTTYQQWTNFVNTDWPAYDAYNRLTKKNGRTPGGVEIKRAWPTIYQGKSSSTPTGYATIESAPVQAYGYHGAQGRTDVDRNLQPVGTRNQIQGIPKSVRDLAGQPTKYSFTARDENGQQKTIYFPDLDTWKEATEKLGYADRNVIDKGKEAHATGYNFQNGGAITVTNPNDPRLQRYKDSLDLYNYSQEFHKRFDEAKARDNGQPSQSNIDFVNWATDDIDKAGFYRLMDYNNGQTPGRPSRETHEFITKINPNGTRESSTIWPYDYAKPQNQVVYKKPIPPRPPLKRTGVQGPKSLRDSVNVGVNGDIKSNVQASQQPTKYSFTARDEDGQQKTIYFPDLDSWREATERLGYSDRNVGNNGKEAHATGYSFQNGGVAMTAEEQYHGLNNSNYDEMYFPNKGYNTFRGLDNGKPVMIQDELGKKLILKGRGQTAKFYGNVYEKRLKRNYGK